MAWRWIARRWVISTFVLFHLSAIAVWTMPQCAIKAQVQGPYCYYVLPLGLWQWWALFAPDPVKNTLTLNAEVVDAKGMRYIHEFPRIAELPWWQKLTRYREPKFTANMVLDEYKTHRKLTARHAVRQLGLGPEAFPMWVSLFLEIKESPTPGTGTADEMAVPKVQVLERFQFQSPKEVRP